MPEKWALYEAELANTPKHLPILNAALAELETLIHCEQVRDSKGIHSMGALLADQTEGFDCKAKQKMSQ
jgi:hypothetical protein